MQTELLEKLAKSIKLTQSKIELIQGHEENQSLIKEELRGRLQDITDLKENIRASTEAVIKDIKQGINQFLTKSKDLITEKENKDLMDKIDQSWSAYHYAVELFDKKVPELIRKYKERLEENQLEFDKLSATFKTQEELEDELMSMQKQIAVVQIEKDAMAKRHEEELAERDAELKKSAEKCDEAESRV
jgi:uncharacterized protein YggU (UPF0235/DUF167 family)